VCGICGVWNYADAAPVDRGLVARMVAALRHRGPDDDGTHFDDAAGLALGFRRLAVVDLTPAARQPMCNEDGSLWLVANGEIYNAPALRTAFIAGGHRFRSRSDSEVILHAYEDRGTECVAALNGMFALALWDAPRRRLLLARDRVGEKPLYTYDDGRRLLFASELKALLVDPRLPRELDWAAAAAYFAVGYVPGAQSIMRGVRKVAAAHAISVAQGRTTATRYWDWRPAFAPAGRRRGRAAYAAELREALRDAVRARLISDRPVGAFLSGGLDSSAIVALMAELGHRPIDTFSVSFDAPAFDEAPHARSVARHLGTRHHELRLTADAARTILPELVAHYDEPFADSSALPTAAVARLAREHVTVCLSGDGGDEVCAGYDWHRHGRLEALVGWIPSGMRRLGLRPSLALPAGALAHRMAQRLMGTPAQRYAAVMTILPEEQRTRLLTPAVHHHLSEAALAAFTDAFAGAADLDLLSRMQVCDASVYLPDDILVKVDRATMGYALEVRCPFLDPEVMAVAARIPPGLRQSLRRGKVVLRDAMHNALPPAIIARRKAGFAVPLHAWLSGPLADLVRNVLCDRRTVERGLFAPAAVARLLARQTRAPRLAPQVWLLLMFELWCRAYLDECASVSAARAVAD
jgi:asparagine synthase (glutamine-hydrolysing)